MADLENPIQKKIEKTPFIDGIVHSKSTTLVTTPFFPSKKNTSGADYGGAALGTSESPTEVAHVPAVVFIIFNMGLLHGIMIMIITYV